MKAITRASLGGILALGLLTTIGAAGASATTAYPDGGTWHYGVREGGVYGSGGQVYSEYKHPTKTHKASACTPSGCAKSGWKAKGTWANAYRSPAAFSGNKAYYDYV